jgi:molybdopterin converting factor small subunit
MEIRVQYFSQLRESSGLAEEVVELPAGATVASLLAHLYRHHPALEKWDRHLLVGAKLEFVERACQLEAGEEIALMPPVQGG